MQCRLETRCAELEKELKSIKENRDQWRAWYAKQQHMNEKFADRWFNRLGEYGFTGDTLEKRMIELEHEYLRFAKEVASVEE